jgi:PAS domain S-box-containing protein
MRELGSQVGQFVERRRAERAVRESDERHRASLQAALDCVITIDHRGRVLEFNPAAERTFGYRADEIVGEDMCERIVPPALRPRHREGFSRYLATGDARVLDRRIEITGIRADGSEFPVELAITRIALPGPPAFTAYLRDISERKRAEQELRASRVRIVESADAARRQFERDIHDGAQSRLVNLGLTLHRIKGRARDGDDSAVPMLDEAIDEIREIVGELRELARGIHPQVLSDGGLEPALNGLASRSPTPVHMRIEALPRLPERVEATVYFLVAEALTNVARYAQADSATVAVSRADGMLDVEVSDDGKGGADPGAGTGLRGLADRVAALDGELRVTSDAGEGTTVSARIPCE